jgi:hypothetical protein
LSRELSDLASTFELTPLENPFLSQPKTHRQKGKGMTAQEAMEALAADIRIYGSGFIRTWFEDGELRHEVISAEQVAADPSQTSSNPTSDRMSVGE